MVRLVIRMQLSTIIYKFWRKGTCHLKNVLVYRQLENFAKRSVDPILVRLFRGEKSDVIIMLRDCNNIHFDERRPRQHEYCRSSIEVVRA
jgi:hypothetical protein